MAKSFRMMFRDWLMQDADKQADKQTEYPEIIRERAGVEKWSLPDLSSYEAQAWLMQKVGYLFTAVSLTAQSAASQEGGVYRLWGERKRPIDNHPFEELMRNPNPLQTGVEFLKSHYAYFLLNGNVYWWLNCDNEYDRPLELWILPPSVIRPEPDENLGIAYYVYDPGNGQEIKIPTWQIAHFKDFHPTSFFVGMGRVQPVKTTIETDIAVQAYMKNLYGVNNGRLPGIIAFRDFIEDTQWKKIKSDMVDASAKSAYMLLRGVGQGGVDLLNAANTIKDMEIWQGREMTEKDIYNIIAPGLLVALSVNSTDSNSKNGNAVFASFTLWPLLRGTAEKITQKILPRYSEHLLWEYDDPRLRDKAMDLAAFDRFAQIAKVNELREKSSEFSLPQLEKLDMDDERGDLFMSQIKADSGIQEPEPEDTTISPEYQSSQTSPFSQQSADEQSVDEYAQDTTEGAVMQDIGRFEKKALKHIGKDVPFSSYVIPAGILDTIHIKLSLCNNEQAVKAVFESARKQMNPQNVFVTFAADFHSYVEFLGKGNLGK